MRCIFCKRDSRSSVSEEHIIPESMGNHLYVLPAGVVCDKCNNYFARKVEKPFLQHPSVLAVRFHEALPSKRGIVPGVGGIISPDIPAKIFRCLEGPAFGVISMPIDCVERFMRQPSSEIRFPFVPDPPQGSTLSRFVAKTAVEAMAHKILQNGPMFIEGWIDNTQFDLIRNHARIGSTPNWPIFQRRIYPACRSILEHGKQVQTVHEFDFFQTRRMEVYFSLALFGFEFTVNVGGPELEGFVEWLKENGEASPLYSGKNSQTRVFDNRGNPIKGSDHV